MCRRSKLAYCPAAGMQRLSHMLPPALAKEMIYLGDPITAQKALNELVNEVVPWAKVLDTAMDWARRLMKVPPLGVRCAKLLVHTGMDNTDLEEEAGMEAQNGRPWHSSFGTEDGAEGMGAFLEKRQATLRAVRVAKETCSPLNF